MTVYLLNLSLTKSLAGKTPGVVWGVADSSSPQTFNYISHVKNPRTHQKKLNDRSAPMVLLGYEIGSKVYHFFIQPKGAWTYISCDIMFDEGVSWSWDAASAPFIGTKPFIVELMSMTGKGAPLKDEAVPLASSPAPPVTAPTPHPPFPMSAYTEPTSLSSAPTPALTPDPP